MRLRPISLKVSLVQGGEARSEGMPMVMIPQEPEDVVKQFIEKISIRPEVIELELRKAVGYRIAMDIHATNDVPSEDIAHFDGYAVRGLESCNLFKVVPEEKESLDFCEAKYVDTGSRVPDNAEAVIPLEVIEVSEQYVRVFKRFRKGFGIIPKGSDFRRGMLVIKRGESIRPVHIKILSDLGLNEVKVFKPLRISVIVTGDEYVFEGRVESLSHIVESFISMLRLGVIVEKTVIEDSVERISLRFKELLAESDVVISIGGTSVGRKDFSYKALQELNPVYAFRGIATHPGRRTSGGVVNGKPVILLPGLVQSCLTGMVFITSPLLSEIYGSKFTLPHYKATLLEDYECPQFVEFKRLRFVKSVESGVKVILGSESAHGFPLLSAEFIIIEKGISKMPSGSIVNVYCLMNYIV
jgi:molybdenum cofactor synthesis domain-containing protein